MNKITILVLTLGMLGILISAIVVLQIDDDLNSGAAQWIEKTQVEKSSDSYLYLLGIAAAKGENPKQVGKKIYESIRAAEQQSKDVTQPLEYEDYPQEKKITLPSGDLYCTTSEKGCFKKIFKNTAALESELHQHALLLLRYRAFIKLNDYAILSRPTMLEPLPPYKYLSAANRLVIFDAIAQAGRGAPIEAVNDLLSNIKQLRIQISNTDTIISKLIFLMLIADSIDVISLINNKYQLYLDNDIELLNQSERDFESAMMREFAMAFYTHMNLDRNPEFFEQGGYIPGWLVRTIFKPNMTLNAIYPDHVNVVRMSRLDAVSFAKELSNEQTPPQAPMSIRNLVGSALNQIASPNWSQYIARFHDVNCKIVLFNALNDNSNKLNKLDQLQNPYGLKSEPNTTEDGKRICFDGPLEDDRYLRCLAIGI